MFQILLILICFCSVGCASLISDFEQIWCSKESLPATFNNTLSTGYFTTPSARMRRAGEFGVGYANVPPYSLINARFQPFSHLELTANYRIFKGVKDHGLSPHGFGDFSDRTAGIKLGFTTPEDSCNRYPGFALGIDDFMGSKRFTTTYLVATQVWRDFGVETSLGWGLGRFRGGSRGFFGGVAYYPFFHFNNPWIDRFAIACEWDPVDYKKDPHPKGRSCKTHFNIGLQYNFADLFNFSLSSIRGKKVACSASVQSNLAMAGGFLPKIYDPPFYCCSSPQSLIEALSTQGFCVSRIWRDQNHLTISLINRCYRSECVALSRIACVLATLPPSENITLILESSGLPCQQYGFTQENLFTRRMEALPPCGRIVYDNPPKMFCPRIVPRFETFLGSRKGKFKYDLGVRAGLDGILPGGVLYDLQLSYTPLSNTKDVSDFDFYNPSQLPNVLTDFVNYRKAGTFSTEKITLQKNWNMGRGLFSSVCGGYFQVNYAGIGGEILWYPANSCFAVGLEGALLRKRRYTGLGFQSKLRRLEGFKPTYQSYTVLSQYFLDFYLDVPRWKIAAKASIGGFLAYDKGLRIELTRYFENGLRFGAWMTVTNAYDKMHGENYFNRGIALEIPLDLFWMKSNRKVCNYGIAAWLRDAGAFMPIGRSLFEIVNRERL